MGKIRKINRVMAVMLALIVAFTACISVKTQAADGVADLFAYRIDVLDSRNSNMPAIEVISDTDGNVYALAQYAGKEEFTAETIKKYGEMTELKAGEEAIAYADRYSYDYFSEGKEYDIYICFETASGALYGPYITKNWTGKYFPAGDGSDASAYQLWSTIHL